MQRRHVFRRIALASCAAMPVPMIVGCPAQTPSNAIAAETTRAIFQSPCAQDVIDCTTSWPVAVAGFAALPGQTVTQTDLGYLVEQPGALGLVPVYLIGSASTMGDGATQSTYSWSSGATQGDPCRLTPGDEFSTFPNPTVYLAPGFHNIRLTVENNIVRDVVESEVCGVLGESIPSFDFVELEVEVCD